MTRDERHRYHWRVLTPEQESAIRTAYDAGVSPTALAAEYAVSARTIFRTVARTLRGSTVLSIGPWMATFEIEKDGMPVQVTPWQAAS